MAQTLCRSRLVVMYQDDFGLRIIVRVKAFFSIFQEWLLGAGEFICVHLNSSEALNHHLFLLVLIKERPTVPLHSFLP